MSQIDWISETVSTLPTILLADEAATVLRTSGRHLRRLVAKGRLAGLHSVEGGSSRLLIPRASLEQYLRNLVSP